MSTSSPHWICTKERCRGRRVVSPSFSPGDKRAFGILPDLGFGELEEATLRKAADVGKTAWQHRPNRRGGIIQS